MQDISYLKELDRLKSDFIHTVSHDLRSPLTSILGYTELVERAGPLNPNQQEFLHRLQSSTQHITALINDLLDLGRLEAGFDTRREFVQLQNILEYSLVMFEVQVKKKKYHTYHRYCIRFEDITRKPHSIRQMLDNLIGNALNTHYLKVLYV